MQQFGHRDGVKDPSDDHSHPRSPACHVCVPALAAFR